MPLDFTEGIQSCICMAAAALAAKNIALEALILENTSLRKENEELVALACSKGGEQVPILLKSLASAQQDIQQLRCRLEEETGLREDLERELEDTAAAAQELWDSMQAVYSEAADSRAHSSRSSQQDSDDEWGTPSGASSPVADRAPSPLEQGLAAAAAAALGATAAAQRRSAAAPPAAAAADSTSEGSVSTPGPQLSAAVLSAVPAAAAAAAAGMGAEAAGINSPLTGILTPLEHKMASLSNKLMGLVTWLDARGTSSPGSTPRSASDVLGSSSRSRVSPLLLSSPIGSIGLGSPVQAAAGNGTATPDSLKGGRSAASRGRPDSSSRRRLSPRRSPRLDFAAAAAAAAAGKGTAALGDAGDAAASSVVDVDVSRVKDSSS